MSRTLLAVAGPVLVMGALGALADAHPGHRGPHEGEAGEAHDDMVELPTVMALNSGGSALLSNGGGAVTLYLTNEGGAITGGWDDSANNVSSVAYGLGDITVPAWGGSKNSWNKIVACVKDRFSQFAIDIVTTRPSRGEYIMMMVGGTPSILNYPDSVGGVAPYTGEVLRSAIGYVFSDSFDNDVENTCVAILHEAGHTLGLDHEYLCEDPMTYMYGCGEKRFQDADAYCGESEARSCASGDNTQNSYQHLARAVGLSDGRVPEPPADDGGTDPTDDDPPWDPGSVPGHDDGGGGGGSTDDNDQVDDGGGWDDGSGSGSDASGPSISLDGDEQSQMPGNQWIQVVVRASDDGGVVDVELGWASDTDQYVLACSNLPDDMPVQCTREGDIFRFDLLVSTGLRAFAARATDRTGNQSISDAHVLLLE